ncbi:hypothetical protein B2A_03371 [mine drainage metagenome]|uniref:Uncharacterized protein n=2 Tax=mine drainage metagenome TaxID=410659 RepID=T1AXD0_9ZZZZ
MRYYHRFGESNALRMVEKTVEGMLAGGINDHLGHGFHRYSTDHEWKIPHFEKMLYDQAMILASLADLYAATRRKNISVQCRIIFTSYRKK